MNIFGIHLDPPFTRVALLKKGKKDFELSLLKGGDELRGKVVTALSAKDFLTRSIELKTTASSHVEEALTFQSEATSHFKLEEILSVPLVQKKEKGLTKALIFTIPKDAMRSHLKKMEELKIDPDRVSTTASALCHFIRWKFPKTDNACVIDLGSQEVTCISIENGQLAKTHAIDIGIEHLLNALLEDRKRILLKKEIEGTAKQLDLLLLKAGLNPHLSGKLGELKGEITKIVHAFCKLEKKDVIFTGRIDAFIHLKEFLIEHADYPLTLEEQKFAISMGLALEQNSKSPLQLRKKEFFPASHWKKLGLYAAVLSSLSILVSGLFLILGNLACQLREEAMTQLTGQETDLDTWMTTIEKNNKEYPYIRQAPTVLEVLCWLSSHPLLEEFAKEEDPIDLLALDYKLVSLPKITSPKDPYSAKVEIEFRLKHPTHARKFHEALLKGDALVNSNLKITWDSLSDSYRTELFLKNREPYVP
jgi:hypothetical protein